MIARVELPSPDEPLECKFAPRLMWSGSAYLARAWHETCRECATRMWRGFPRERQRRRGMTEQRLHSGVAKLARKGQTTAMTDRWHDIDDAIVNCVPDKGSMTPVEIGRQLGM